MIRCHYDAINDASAGREGIGGVWKLLAVIGSRCDAMRGGEKGFVEEVAVVFGEFRRGWREEEKEGEEKGVEEGEEVEEVEEETMCFRTTSCRGLFPFFGD